MTTLNRQVLQDAWGALERLLDTDELRGGIEQVPPPFRQDVADLKMALGAIQGLQVYANPEWRAGESWQAHWWRGTRGRPAS